MADEYRMTSAELEALKDRLKHLRSEGIREVTERIGEARAYGDLSENSEYDEAKSDQARLQAEIQQLEYQISHAVVMDSSTLNVERVTTGLWVSVYDRSFNETMDYHIVSAAQADPLSGKISDESPVGRALLDHEVGDVVTVEIPNGNTEIEIRKIYKA